MLEDEKEEPIDKITRQPRQSVHSDYPTSYQIAVYLLLNELESLQLEGDGLTEQERVYYAQLLIPLLDTEHMSMPVLLCYLLRGVGTEGPLLSRYIQTISTGDLDKAPGDLFTPGHLFCRHGPNQNFLRRRSILGIAANRVETGYSRLNFGDQMEIHRRWGAYLAQLPSEEEISTFTERGLDLSSLMSTLATHLSSIQVAKV